MNNKHITDAQSAVLNLIGHSLFSMPIDLKKDVDWRAVAKESRTQSVVLLAFRDYCALPIDDELKNSLKSYFKKCAAANINCYSGHKRLHTIMTENSIPYCIFKGPVSAWYYPDPLLRNMGDVDFYVSPENYDAAKAALLRDGFEISGEENLFHHVTFKKGASYFELHPCPVAVPNENMRPLFLEYWSDIFKTSYVVKDVFGEYVFPSAFLHGFILITHFQKHLFLSGIGLRHLCDFAVFVNSFSNEEFREIFEERFKRAGLWRFAKALSLIAVKYLGMERREWMGDDYAIADVLLVDILRGGNFGLAADADRGNEGMFVSHSKDGGAGKSRLLSMFRYMNKHVKNRWKIVEKCPLLYPVGWVYFTVRFLFRRIIGKVKVNLFKSYKESAKRIELYNSLKIFEPEDK